MDAETKALIAGLQAKLQAAVDQGAAKEAQIAALIAQMQMMAGAVQQLTEMLKRQGTTVTGIGVSTITIQEVYDAYEKDKKGSHSWWSYEDKLTPLTRRLGSLPAMELTPKKWRQHIEARKDEPTCRNKPPSVGTLRQELVKAQGMLNWATEEDQALIPFNPLRSAKAGKPAPPKRSWLPETEIEKLVRAPEPKGTTGRLVLRAFVYTKADTGLRFEELRKLRRDRVRRSNAEDDETNLADIPNTKNDKSHVVGLTDRAFEALEAMPHVLGSPYYFANPETKKPYSKKSFQRWFNDAVISSGVDAVAFEGERITPHTMRRTAATNAHARGATLLEVQRMLNHSSPNVTAQYVQLNEHNATKIARLMQKGAIEDRKGPHRSPQQRVTTTTTRAKI